MNIRTAQVLASALFASTPALGAISSLDPGATVGLVGISSAEDPTLQASVVHDFGQDFEIIDPAGEPLMGRLVSRASVRIDTGQIDFNWRIIVLDGKTGQIESIAVTGYEGWSVGVEYRTDSVGLLGPSEASRSIDADTVGYVFDPTLTGFFGTHESHYFFARTDAFEFAMTGTATITMTNGESVTLATWAPAVPTPSGLALLGLGGMIANRRRRES